MTDILSFKLDLATNNCQIDTQIGMSDTLTDRMAVMALGRKEQDVELLQAALAKFPDGASLEQIAAEAHLPVSTRTLIRRLSDMVDDGFARKAGQSRAARYFLTEGNQPKPVKPLLPVQQELFVPVSKAGAKAQAVIRKPHQTRKIVGYVRDFLDDYRPNVTSYLSTTERDRLRSVGKPNVAVQAAGTYAKNVLNRLLIDLSWNSSRLEGNTYSLLDTKRLVDYGQEAEGKDRREAQMILNHKAAIEFLVGSADEIGFNRLTLLNLHALLADGLLEDADSPGRLRSILIGIGGSTYHPPGVPQQIAECFDQVLATAEKIGDPFEQALFVMVQLPYLQPFDDVNKRVSRLAANIPLIKGNFCPLSFIDVPKETYTEAMLAVYELNDVSLLKDVFIWAYERSANRYAAVRQQIGEPDPFRLRHRAELREVVGDVLRGAMDRATAFRHIATWSEVHLNVSDQAPFRELAETELMALHEGNFARYQVRPAEFSAWQKKWRSG